MAFKLVLVCLSLSFAGCVRISSLEYDFDSFIAELTQSGIQVTETGQKVNHGFSQDGISSITWGQKLLIDGEELFVYDFRNHDDAVHASERIQGGGYSVRLSYGEYNPGPRGNIPLTQALELEWDQPPHFFLEGHLIVVYLGTNTRLIELLENILDRQFEGDTSYHTPTAEYTEAPQPTVRPYPLPSPRTPYP